MLQRKYELNNTLVKNLPSYTVNTIELSYRNYINTLDNDIACFCIRFLNLKL